MEILTQANLTCPSCGATTAAVMPTDSCQVAWECTHCGGVWRPKAGDCCVFCSYADRPCPPVQVEGRCCGG